METIHIFLLSQKRFKWFYLTICEEVLIELLSLSKKVPKDIEIHRIYLLIPLILPLWKILFILSDIKMEKRWCISFYLFYILTLLSSLKVCFKKKKRSFNSKRELFISCCLVVELLIAEKLLNAGIVFFTFRCLLFFCFLTT